jgi:hypothetical protein
MTPNRFVALITPVCALAAGWAATWLADNVPGLNVNADQLQAVFIAGAVAVLAPALQWLYGWQKYEARQAAAEQLAVLEDRQTALMPDDQLGDLYVPEEEEEEEEEELEELDEEAVPIEDEEPVTSG